MSLPGETSSTQLQRFAHTNWHNGDDVNIPVIITISHGSKLVRATAVLVCIGTTGRGFRVSNGRRVYRRLTTANLRFSEHPLACNKRGGTLSNKIVKCYEKHRKTTDVDLPTNKSGILPKMYKILLLLLTMLTHPTSDSSERHTEQEAI